MHVRNQIRDAFVTALTATGITTESGRVFAAYNGILPLFSVYSREESIETDNNRGRIMKMQLRTTTISVEIYVKAQSGIDDTFDNLAVRVEEAIFNDAWLSDRTIVSCLDLESMETEVDSGGENALGVMTLNFSCRYKTEDGKPEIFI